MIKSIRKNLCWMIEKDSDCNFLDLFSICSEDIFGDQVGLGRLIF